MVDVAINVPVQKLARNNADKYIIMAVIPAQALFAVWWAR